MAQPTSAQRMEQVMRTYFQACNEADAAAIAACFCPEATHYLLPPLRSWSGAATISSNLVQIVREQGRYWTVDQLLTDADRGAAILEWTSFNPQQGRIARGVDWFVFEPQTWRIQEVRSYTAAPIHPDMVRQEFVDFDYAGRGYPTTFLAEQKRGES